MPTRNVVISRLLIRFKHLESLVNLLLLYTLSSFIYLKMRIERCLNENRNTADYNVSEAASVIITANFAFY